MKKVGYLLDYDTKDPTTFKLMYNTTINFINLKIPVND